MSLKSPSPWNGVVPVCTDEVLRPGQKQAAEAVKLALIKRMKRKAAHAERRQVVPRDLTPLVWTEASRPSVKSKRAKQQAKRARKSDAKRAKQVGQAAPLLDPKGASGSGDTHTHKIAQVLSSTPRPVGDLASI